MIAIALAGMVGGYLLGEATWQHIRHVRAITAAVRYWEDTVEEPRHVRVLAPLAEVIAFPTPHLFDQETQI